MSQRVIEGRQDCRRKSWMALSRFPGRADASGSSASTLTRPKGSACRKASGHGREMPVETPVDSELVRAAKAGDRQALGALLEQYLPLVHGVVVAAMNGGPDVDDVVQDTMVAAVADLAHLPDDRSFRGWLLRLTAQEIRQGLR